MKERILPTALLAVLFCASACDKPAGGGAVDSTKAAAADSLSTGLPGSLERTADTLRLSLLFKKGEAFGFSITTRQDVKNSVDTMVEKSTQSTTVSYRFDVDEVLPDGSARLRATCLRVVFSGNYTKEGVRRSMLYDSEEKNDPAKEKTFAQYNAPVNTPFEALISKDGRISGVTKYDGVIKRLLGGDYGKVAKNARDRIGESYAEEGLKNIIQMAFQKFEDRPVGIDSSWKHSWTGAVGFLKIRNDATYVLKGFKSSPELDGRLAYIEGRLQSTYTGPKVLDTGEGNATIEKFNVRGVGLTVFSMKEGKPVSRTLRQARSTSFFVEPPAELREQAPDRSLPGYRWAQEATVENTVARIKL